MQASFKLFLGNQRISRNQSQKLKKVKGRPARLLTINHIEKSKQLSARLYSDQKQNNCMKIPSNLMQKLQNGNNSILKRYPNGFKNKRRQSPSHKQIKISLSNHEPLRYLKPQMLRQRKKIDNKLFSEKQINHNLMNDKNEIKQIPFVEYMTEFLKDQEGQNTKRQKANSSKHLRVSINVLRTKLKKIFDYQ